MYRNMAALYQQSKIKTVSPTELPLNSGAEKEASTNRHAAALYKKSNINTASPAELTLMLYNGAVKFCNMAITDLDKGDLEGCNRNIAKTKKIIVEFRSTLDFKYDVANDFDRMYDYIHWVLTQANVKKDKALLEEGLKRLRIMRDIWKELMEVAKPKEEKEETEDAETEKTEE